jgi:triosephosphate isomerase
MRQPIIAGNWKMNKTIPESIRLVTELKNRISGKRDVLIIVAPSFTALNSVNIAIQNTNIKLAAQNVCWEDGGAFTGEISAKMLTDIGCEYVVIGHSERRKYLNETNTIINKKISLCIEENLIPILCIGETLEERKSEKTFNVLNLQLKESLLGLNVYNVENIIIAYEPVWAIGTGNAATSKDAEDAHKFTRETLSSMFGGVVSEKIRLIYGGSVVPENIKELMQQKNIDGALVGGASLNATTFAKIVGYNEE